MKSLRDSLKEALSASHIALEDSGNGERLERFGKHLIRRPSSVAIWNRRLDRKTWDSADAIFVPQKGWNFSQKPVDEWPIELAGLSLKLRPQENGQIGLFPEHLTYFEEMSLSLETLKSKLNRAPRVLNLFAYTGAASLWCAQHGCEVTHIELSKKVLSWAKENQDLNQNMPGSIRFIPEDTLTFVEREIRRESFYDLIIADPPSFSRLSKSQSWDLEEVAIPLVRSLTKVLNAPGTVFITSHHPALDAYAFENLFRDSELRAPSFRSSDLTLVEQNGERRLGCGSLLITDVA